MRMSKSETELKPLNIIKAKASEFLIQMEYHIVQSENTYRGWVSHYMKSLTTPNVRSSLTAQSRFIFSASLNEVNYWHLIPTLVGNIGTQILRHAQYKITQIKQGEMIC